MPALPHLGKFIGVLLFGIFMIVKTTLF